MKIKNLIPIATAAAVFALTGCSPSTSGSLENNVNNDFKITHLGTSTNFGVLEQTDTSGFAMTSTSSIVNIQEGDFHELLVTQIEGEPEVNFNDLLPEAGDLNRLMQEKYIEVKGIISNFDLPEEAVLTPSMLNITQPTIVAGDELLDFDLYSKSITVTFNDVKDLLTLQTEGTTDIFDNVPELLKEVKSDTQFQLNVLYMGLETPEEMTAEEQEYYNTRRELIAEGELVFIGFSIDIIETLSLEQDIEVAFFDRDLQEGSTMTMTHAFVVQFGVPNEDVDTSEDVDSNEDVSANENVDTNDALDVNEAVDSNDDVDTNENVDTNEDVGTDTDTDSDDNENTDTERE